MRAAEFHGYVVYEDGRVWRPVMQRIRRDGVVRKMPGGWVSTRVRKADKGQGGGYLYLTLWIDSAQQTWLLHRLIALVFVPNPGNKPTVNHRDGNRANCEASNLEWATHSENQTHAVRHVHGHHGSAHARAKLTAAQVAELRFRRNVQGEKLTALAEDYGVVIQTVSAIARGERYAFES